jgi:hypothetical protein
LLNFCGPKPDTPYIAYNQPITTIIELERKMAHNRNTANNQPNSTNNDLAQSDKDAPMSLTELPAIDTAVVERNPITLIGVSEWTNHLGTVKQYTVANVIVWDNGIPIAKRGLAGALGERAGISASTLYFGELSVIPELGAVVIHKNETTTSSPVLDDNGQPTVNKAGKPIVKTSIIWTWIKSIIGAVDASGDTLFVNANDKSTNLPALQPARNMIDMYATAHNIVFVEPTRAVSTSATAALRDELASKDAAIATMDKHVAEMESERAAFIVAMNECKLAVAAGEDGAIDRLFALMSQLTPAA